MKVLPTYLFLIKPSPYGIPEALAYPIAAGIDESGTGNTKSASIGYSLYNASPILSLVL